MTAVEGHPLAIPCVAPHPLLNFSLTWAFSSSTSSEPGAVLLRYDSRSRGSSGLWEGQAELEPDRAVEGDGSLWLRSPDSLEHSGLYVCTFSALHSKHTVQTRLNVTTAPQSESRGRQGCAGCCCDGYSSMESFECPQLTANRFGLKCLLNDSM